MTDIQFRAFVRFLLDALYAAESEKDSAMQEIRFKKVISNLEEVIKD
jgi:hypothetical protein